MQAVREPVPTGQVPTGPVTGREAASRLLSGTLAAMSALEGVLEAEAAHIAAGRLRAGLADAAGKSEIAAAYLLGLQSCKANVVALARFAPDLLAAFRAAQARFMASVERNQSVIATARAVAEGLVKSLAAEVERSKQVGGYGRPPIQGASRPAPASPLVFSGRF